MVQPELIKRLRNSAIYKEEEITAKTNQDKERKNTVSKPRKRITTEK